MKQVLTTAFFLVSVGAAVAYAGTESRHEAFHAAMDACLTENNLTRPEPGTRPSDADRLTMDTCLKAKGFDHPPGHPPGGPRPDREAASSDD